MKHLICLIFAVMFAGCAVSEKTRIEQSNRIPLSGLYAYGKPSDAHLVVAVDGSYGYRCKVRVLIDGKPAADIRPGESAHFGLTFGTHTLSTRPSEECYGRGAQDVKINLKTGDALMQFVGADGIHPVST
ncbi:hypothetical protein [Pseudomonas monsensis]